ncbi:hypothetical protein TWF281_006582 [Arthrobotrys megalospora]
MTKFTKNQKKQPVALDGNDGGPGNGFDDEWDIKSPCEQTSKRHRARTSKGKLLEEPTSKKRQRETPEPDTDADAVTTKRRKSLPRLSLDKAEVDSGEDIDNGSAMVSNSEPSYTVKGVGARPKPNAFDKLSSGTVKRDIEGRQLGYGKRLREQQELFDSELAKKESEHLSQLSKLQDELNKAKERARASETELAKAEKKLEHALKSLQQQQQERLQAERANNDIPRTHGGNNQLLSENKTEIRILQRQNQALQADLKAEKRRNEELETQQSDTEAQLERYRVRVREYEFEATRRGPVLLDTDVRENIELLFGQRLRTWTRSAISGLGKDTIMSMLGILEQNPAVRHFFSFDSFNSSARFVLESVTGPAFFEILISSTLISKLFDNPFFLCPPEMGDGLRAFREMMEQSDLPAACEWTAKTVALLESSGQVNIESFQQSFAETLNGYMRMFMDENKRLNPQRIAENERILAGIVRDCAHLALGWHKYKVKVGPINKRSWEALTDSPLWQKRYQEFCVPHKGDIEDIDEGKNFEILAIVTPGFVKYTDPDGCRLDKPHILIEATAAVREFTEDCTELKADVKLSGQLSAVQGTQNTGSSREQPITTSQLSTPPATQGI